MGLPQEQSHNRGNRNSSRHSTLRVNEQNPSPLRHLMATDYLATDEIPGVNGAAARTFLGDGNFDPEPDITNMRIAKLPAAIPLPFGHGLNSTRASDEAGMNVLAGALSGIDDRMVSWLQAMHHNASQFDGVSLHHESLSIPAEYFQPLIPSDQLNQIDIECIPLDPTFPPAPQIMERLAKVQDSNMEQWLQNNRPVYDAIMDKLAPLLGGPSNPPPCESPPSQPEIRVVTSKTSAEEKEEVKIQKALSMAKLLLGHKEPATDTYVPAKLSDDYVELVEEGTAKTAMRNLQQQLGEHAKARRSNMDKVIEYKTNMPMGIVNVALTAALISGHFGLALLHETNALVGQNLTIFSFLRAGSETVGYKRAHEENNTVFTEQLIGETSTNATKVSTNPFSNGEQRTYDDLLAAVANLHAVLTFMLHPDEHSMSRIVTDLECLFKLLAEDEFETWFKYHATGNVTWLCHSILVDVHNYARQMVLVATTPSHQRAVIRNETLKASTLLAETILTMASVEQKWKLATGTNSLSAYNSEPSTWSLLKPKDPPKKKAKTDQGGSKPPAETPPTNSGWGRFGSPPASRASDPTKGRIEATNALSLRSAPRLSSNKKLLSWPSLLF